MKEIFIKLCQNIVIIAVRLLSRVSILTRDIDIANMSVRPSVCLSVCPSVRPLRSGIV